MLCAVCDVTMLMVVCAVTTSAILLLISRLTLQDFFGIFEFGQLGTCKGAGKKCFWLKSVKFGIKRLYEFCWQEIRFWGTSSHRTKIMVLLALGGWHVAGNASRICTFESISGGLSILV